MRPRHYWPLFLFVMAWALCSGCAHRYASQQSANRTDQEHRQSQTEARVEEKTQSVATEKKQGSKRTREFDPKTGTLIRDVLEQYQSDGRLQVDTSASASASATAAVFRSVVASSSSARQADTRVAWWSPWWLLLVIPLAGVVWLGWRWVKRSATPFL